jgi:hypothetical protein
MSTFRRKATEQEVKGVGQKVKGELNQVGGHLRSRAAEAGRKISKAVERDKPRGRR